MIIGNRLRKNLSFLFLIRLNYEAFGLSYRIYSRIYKSQNLRQNLDVKVRGATYTRGHKIKNFF